MEKRHDTKKKGYEEIWEILNFQNHFERLKRCSEHALGTDCEHYTEIQASYSINVHYRYYMTEARPTADDP